MILYKWIYPGQAPGLINSIIEFAMMAEPEVQLYPGQAQIQKVMFILMLVCIPWMLIMKPVLLKFKHSKSAPIAAKADLEMGSDTDSSDDDDDDEFEFGEEAIHQLIETIEFALGAISNT